MKIEIRIEVTDGELSIHPDIPFNIGQLLGVAKRLSPGGTIEDQHHVDRTRVFVFSGDQTATEFAGKTHIQPVAAHVVEPDDQC